MAIQPTSKDLKKGEIVAGTVSEVHPFGVVVRIDENTTGYVRRRELTLSGNQDPRTVVKVGERLKAIVISPANESQRAELSVRNLKPDPWPSFAREHKVGDPIIVTVKHLFADGLLAEHVPGVDGFIPTKELSSDPNVEKPEAVIWVGDRTEASIVRLDASSKHMVLSVSRWIARLAETEPFMQRLYDNNLLPSADTGTTVEAPVASIGRLDLGGLVLIVDDDDGVREQLITSLQPMGIKAIGAASAAEALSVHSKQELALILVDLDMPGENGLSFIDRLRAIDPVVPIAVISGPDLVSQNLQQLVELGVSDVCLKPIDLTEVRTLLSDLSRENSPRLSLDDARFASPSEEIAYRQLIRKGYDFATRVDAALKALAKQLKADKVMVFHLAPKSPAISLVAQAGEQSVDERRLSLLFDSPVKNVIEENEPVAHGKVSAARSKRFEKLMEFMAFESVLGLPLMAGGRVEHALFVFSRNSDAFSAHDEREAHLTAMLLEVIIESQLLEQRVIEQSQLMLAGQLTSAFKHEVHNHVTNLDLRLKNAARTLRTVVQEVEHQGDSASLPELERRVLAAEDSSSILVKTVREFQQLMRPANDTMTDINEVVAIAIRQVELQARRHNVSIRQELAEELPRTIANPVRLQQVFLNLLLNAHSHVIDRPEGWRAIRVSTRYCQDSGDGSVQVRVSDTGVGIHRNLWQTIFELGYTTREGGSGLGLFVAKSFVEALGGVISVEDSLIQIGTTFLVEIPVRHEN